ncbi:hypothetical protein ACJZ2D_008077 [Fusarium nematophilum]
MASHDPLDGTNLDLWPFDLIDQDFDISSPGHVEETRSGHVQPPANDGFEEGWWFSPQTDSHDTVPQQQVAVNGDGKLFNDFAFLSSPTAGISTPTTPGVLPHPFEHSMSSLPSSTTDDHLMSHSNTSTPPKIGARFTKDSLRILRSWLVAHGSDPYPSDAEKTRLQERTGLTKTQLTNWLANARRRSKIAASRNTSPQESGQPKPIAIPPRPPTPAVRDGSSFLNPLERWVESPPENEPASVSAIARAVASNSSLFEDSTNPDSLSRFSYLQDTPSAGSIDTSLSSGGSFSSANSYGSQKSLQPFESFGRTRSRRKKKRCLRRAGGAGAAPKTPLRTVGKMFQCTFCTETFGRKYDWQRHENSVHLPLERWVCAPNGPRAPNLNNSSSESCVFCGLANPDDEHVEGHHYSACQDRSLEQRTFNRKDHLRQHLRLFHDVGFEEWAMQGWRVTTPDIRSRCGFCGRSMSTWEERADHISNHFKLGKTMADWEGDWGFEPCIAEIVEHAIPPYIIETERHSPFPFQGSRAPCETPRSAFELIKLELAYFMQRHFDKHGRMPTIENMQLDACRIILAAETRVQREEGQPAASWLRDLIVSNSEMLQRARLSPVRSPHESRLFSMRINGKVDLFQECDLEAQLREFVQARGSDADITDRELRDEACQIVVRMDRVSLTPSDFIATWIVRLIHSSADWLSGFRHRMNIPQAHGAVTPEEPSITATIYDYTQSEQALELIAQSRMTMGVGGGGSSRSVNPEHLLRLSPLGEDRPQTEADFWLSAFNSFEAPMKHAPLRTTATLQQQQQQQHSAPNSLGAGSSEVLPGNDDQSSLLDARAVMMKTNGFFLNDPNFHRWIGEELGRWAVATMSPHNPARHVPTDEEIQHYARWIAYNDGDPLNQTLADNTYWLARFKREVGILEKDQDSEMGISQGLWPINWASAT